MAWCKTMLSDDFGVNFFLKSAKIFAFGLEFSKQKHCSAIYWLVCNVFARKARAK